MANRTWWENPENKQEHLQRKAERLGTTVEALQRPRAWAPLPERRRAYLGLIREGKTVGDVYKMYPNEEYDVIWRVGNKERIRAFNELGDLM